MFQFKPDKNYRMPPYFGAPEFEKDYEVRVNDALSMKFTIETAENRLADYLPEGFELLRPEMNIGFNQLWAADFLFGGGYNLIQVDVPARFAGKRDRFEGNFPLVIWENLTRPIFGGREESGQPKVFADILNLHIFNGLYYTTAGYDGNTFLKMEMKDLVPVDQDTLRKIVEGSANYNNFGWRYIPKVGEPGAELSQPILYPQSMEAKGAWTGGGGFEWIKLDEKYKYADPVKKQIDAPSQYEMISQLADLPVYDMKPGMIITGAIVMRPYSGRVLE